MSSHYKVILFDLGGVLLRLGDPLEIFGIEASQEAFHEQWLLSPVVRAIESGQIDEQEFFEKISGDLGLSYSAEEFRERFIRWPIGLYEGITDLLDGLAERYELVLLSNTNPVHWHQAGVASELGPRLSKTLLSYETGHLKPDQAAFEDAIRSVNAEAAEILFLDDNPLNIEAAQRAGIDAMLTRGYDSLIRNLKMAGVT